MKALMKKTAVFLFLMAIPAMVTLSRPAPAAEKEQREIHQLEQRLKEVSGKEKIDILVQLRKLTYNKTPEKSLAYGKQVLELTQSPQQLKTRADMLDSLGFVYNKMGDRIKAIDSIKAALEIFRTL